MNRAVETELGTIGRWSRYLTTGDGRRWHLLDSHAGRATASAGTPTLVCVHGNPTWSYLWRRVLATAPPGWRVVAPDQLGMGWSERRRPGDPPRRLDDRIDDLDRLLGELGVDGPVALAVHDWGGPVGLGWAVRLAGRGEAGRLRGLVITNTAVHQPDRRPPALIRLARWDALRTTVTRTTAAFVRGAPALSWPRPAAAVRGALAAPYRTAARRQSVADFVADIPLEPEHPSRAALDAVADGLTRLRDVPALVLWGARDPVFTAAHLADLLDRLPQAQVQRYPAASHLVTEDVPGLAELVWRRLEALPAQPEPPQPTRGSKRISDRAPLSSLPTTADDRPAVVTLDRTGTPTTTSAADLARRVDRAAAGLATAGVGPGSRVALLVPAGVDLAVAVFGCWRVGASVVVTDANLGLRSLAAALGSAAPDVVLGTAATGRLASLLRIPGRRLVLERLERLEGSRLPGQERTPTPGAGTGSDTEAAVLFTSGATGPPKGVVYTADRLRAQLDAVEALIGLRPDDRLVAAFAPFLLYGPALGLPVVVPAMDPSRPSTLTATAFAEAVDAVAATVVFASPAALATVVSTATGLDPAHRRALAGVRLVFSAGAPVGATLLAAVAELLPHAELHAPYGMTELLPATDVTDTEIRAAGPGDGVLVGTPRPGVRVRIAPLGTTSDSALTDAAGVTGEVVVTGAHLKTRYDRLWAVESAAARPAGWHRTGDVGHLDDRGRLWIEGRLAHVVDAADGPVTPVGVEQRLERLDDVAQAALVGVGPDGTRQLVAVLRPAVGRAGRRLLAPPALAAAAREAAGVPLAAVLTVDRLPLDVRHRAKIDRTALSRWAERVLAGGHARPPR